MKTPKVATPKPKLKFNTPKSGLVRKSLGANATASLKKLTTKGKDQVLSMVKDNEDNVEFKSKTPKKARMSLPANALRNAKSSPENSSDAKTPKKSPKNKKAATPESPKSGKNNNLNNRTPAKDSPLPKSQNAKKTPQNKNVPQNVLTPSSVENNTSPVKQNMESKKNKVPLNLDDSLFKGTPNGLQQKKGNAPGKGKPNSPEVELGLQLEEALSPKSRKEKKKKMSIGVKVAAQGKVTVEKKLAKKLDSTSNDSGADAVSKKRKRRKTRKGNQKSEEKQPSFIKLLNATNAVNALLKATKPQKNDLLSGDDYIFMQFNLVKQARDDRGVYKLELPHSILPDSPEVCLIVPDLKGKRNEPEEAIEHYKELLKKNDITSITEIIPIRKLKQDYSQFEEKRKLSNRLDCIISDGRITHVAQLGKRFARAKKCICPIKFDSKSLKEDVARALRKVAIFSSGKGTSFSVKCGRRGIPAKDIAENIVAIGEFLANNKNLIGDPLNVSMATIKTASSNAFPVYVSTVTPNEVKKPIGKPKKEEEPVEDEVTTVPEGTVVVYPSGNVKVKKRKNEEEKDDDEEAKGKGNKKAKQNVSKKAKVEASDDDEEEDSDVDMGSDEEDSAVDSLNGTDDEASDDDEGSEDDDDDDGSEDDDDESIDEEEIEAAEKAYLEELRALQNEIGNKKTKKSGKVTEKKGEQVKEKNKNAAAKDGKKQEEKKGLQNEQKNKKVILKEQDTNANAKGKKGDKQKNQVKGAQNNVSKKNQGASPQNQQKGNQNQKKNKFGSPQNQQKGNQNQKKNKFGSPQNQQKGKELQLGKGKGPNKRNAQQQGGSPKQGRKQFKKGPGGKNKN